MLRIQCPVCLHSSDEDDFTYGGPFTRRRPARPELLDDQAWARYMFERENPRGAALERWRHTYGCRQWFGLERDTESHVIARTFALEGPLAPSADMPADINEEQHATTN